jgi:hypothetical protein
MWRPRPQKIWKPSIPTAVDNETRGGSTTTAQKKIYAGKKNIVIRLWLEKQYTIVVPIIAAERM